MRVTGNYFSSAMVNQLNVFDRPPVQAAKSESPPARRSTPPRTTPPPCNAHWALRAQKAGLAQFEHNISLLHERADASFNSLKAIKKISDRAGELATLADGTRSPEELTAYGNEVTQLIKQAAQLSNSKNRGILSVRRHGLRTNALHGDSGRRRCRHRSELQRQCECG